MRKLLALLLPLACALPAWAGAEVAAEARAKRVAPFLDEQTVAVAYVQTARLDLDVLAARLARAGNVNPKAMVHDMSPLRQTLDGFKAAGGKDLYAVFSLSDMRHMPFLVIPLAAGADGKELTEFLQGAGTMPPRTVEKVGQALFVGSKESLERVRSAPASARPELAKAFAAAGAAPLQLLLLPTADNRRVLEEMLPELPKQAGGGPITALTRGLQWAALGAELAPDLSVRATVKSPDEASAQKLHAWIINVFTALADNPAAARDVPNLKRLAALMTPKVQGAHLTLAVGDQDLTTVLLPMVQNVRTAAGRAQSTNNLKQLGLALHRHHDINKTFPRPASVDKQGKPLLSWRVHVLPYLNEDKLYKEFRLTEPWDSAHNKKLIERMPPLLRSPLSAVGDSGKTTYVLPVGKATMFPGNKGVRFADIRDGSSNTIMLVETLDSHAVIWTRPDDLVYDPKTPLAGLIDAQRTIFHAGFADGSVRTINGTINLDILRALFTRAGDEPISEF